MDTTVTAHQATAKDEALEFLRHEADIAEQLGRTLGFVDKQDEEHSKQRVEKLRRVASLVELQTLLEQQPAGVVFAGQPITCEAIEKAHIDAVVRQTETLDQAALILGIDISTLYRKRRRWGMPLQKHPRS